MEQTQVKGKVGVKWESELMDGVELKEIQHFSNRVVVDYELGAWFMLSLSGEMELELANCELKRGLWNLGMMILLILWSAWCVIISYDLRDGDYTQREGFLLLFGGVFLLSIYWLHWRMNTNVIRKTIKSILLAGVCVDGFVFAKDGNLDDESIKGRAIEYHRNMSRVNKALMDGWFNIHYVIPKAFEDFVDYDKRLREIIYTTVTNTENLLLKNDEMVFLEVNKRQVKQAENDVLIEVD